MPPLPHLFAQTTTELAALVGGTGRAREIWAALRAGEEPTARLSARAAAELRAHCALAAPRVAARARSECGAVKLLLELADGEAIESVVIPGPGRTTLCVSTQVGCARGCAFCVTATMGLGRNLTADEIVAQVLAAGQEVRDGGLPPLRNVVFMGMGEPLDNLAAVQQSLRVLGDPLALRLPPRHLTVSTVGPTARRVRQAQALPAALAWSLHTADPALRRRLIPQVRADLGAVRQAFAELAAARRDLLFVEVVLLDGVNDALADAERLITFLAPLLPRVRVNLLPFNPGRDGFAPSPAERVERFQRFLRDRGIFCAIRRPRGAGAAAACGQLAVRR